MNQKKQDLENRLQQAVGIPVEITVRGPRNFTFSFDGYNVDAMCKLQQFFLGMLTGIDFDEECNLSYAYLDL